MKQNLDEIKAKPIIRNFGAVVFADAIRVMTIKKKFIDQMPWMMHDEWNTDDLRIVGICNKDVVVAVPDKGESYNLKRIERQELYSFFKQAHIKDQDKGDRVNMTKAERYAREQMDMLPKLFAD